MTDWKLLAKHKEEVVKSTGQWAAIFDENFDWLTDVDIDDLDFKNQRNASTSFTAKAIVKSVDGGLPHPVVGHLVGEGLGSVDSDGALVPVTDGARFLVVERAGSTRVAGRIGFTKASGDGDTPSVLEISGMSLVGELSLIPSPASPKSWREATWRTFERTWGDGEDAGLVLVKPRQLAGVIVGKNDIYTAKTGTAEVVTRAMIEEAIDATYTTCGLSEAEYPLRVSTRSTGKKSPEIMAKPTDSSLLATIADFASAAGITIVPQVWFPGEPQPDGLTLTLPTIVFHVLQG